MSAREKAPTVRRLVVLMHSRDKEGVTRFVRAGHASANNDGSINIWLDQLPLDGTLHVREADVEPLPEVTP